MTKKTKKIKRTPNFVVFLVEGESDTIILETALSDMIYKKNPDFEVRFLLQQKLVNKSGDEMDDSEDDEDDSIIEEYELGGDITSSSFVKPENIEKKITTRFITPATKSEGLYPK